MPALSCGGLRAFTHRMTLCASCRDTATQQIGMMAATCPTGMEVVPMRRPTAGRVRAASRKRKAAAARIPIALFETGPDTAANRLKPESPIPHRIVLPNRFLLRSGSSMDVSDSFRPISLPGIPVMNPGRIRSGGRAPGSPSLPDGRASRAPGRGQGRNALTAEPF